MMSRFQKRVVFGFFPVAMLILNDAAAAAPLKLVLTGSSTIAPLVNEIAKRFEAKNPDIRVDVQSGGSSRGMSDVRSGMADIGMVSRGLKQEEGDLVPHTIAIDVVSMIIHKKNPIAALTHQQILDIFTGKITNWKSVGGEDRKITVVNKAEGRSTLEIFLSHFKLNNRDIRAQVVVGENQQGIKSVAGNLGAIGYVSLGAAEFEEKNGTAIRLLPLSNAPASAENVRSGKFPMARPLNLITKGTISDPGRRFIQFSQSSEVRDLVQAQFLFSPQP